MDTPQKLIIKNFNEVYYIPFNDIVYVKADGNYCNIHLSNGHVIETVSYQRAEVARMIEQQAPEIWKRDFALVGRTYLINLNHVMHIHPAARKLTFIGNPFGTEKKMQVECTPPALRELISIMENRNTGRQRPMVAE